MIIVDSIHLNNVCLVWKKRQLSDVKTKEPTSSTSMGQYRVILNVLTPDDSVFLKPLTLVYNTIS